MRVPVEDYAYRQEGRFFNGEIGGELMFVPAEEHRVGNRLNVHMGTAHQSSVVGSVFDHLFVKTAVLAPTGDGVELVKGVGKFWGVKVAVNHFRAVTILFLLAEFLADKKLE